MNDNAKLHAYRTDNQAFNEHSKHRAQCSVNNNHSLVAHKTKDCYSLLQLRLFCTVFGVTEEYIQRKQLVE